MFVLCSKQKNIYLGLPSIQKIILLSARLAHTQLCFKGVNGLKMFKGKKNLITLQQVPGGGCMNAEWAAPGTFKSAVQQLFI